MEHAKSLVVTGHRPPRLGGYHASAVERVNEFAHRALAARRNDQTRPEFDFVAIGMSQGWDLACARACMLLDIPYVAYIPFPDFQRRWPMAMQRVYSYLVDHATNQVMVSHSLTRDGSTRAQRMTLERNTRMLEHGVSVLALCYDTEQGGTADTIRKATARGIPVDNLWPTWEAFNGGNHGK